METTTANPGAKKNDAILLKIMTTTVPTRNAPGYEKKTHSSGLATLATLTLAAAATSATRESTNERVRQ